jgi:CAAX protease family protein
MTAASEVARNQDTQVRRRGWLVELVWILAILLAGNLLGAALVFVWAWWSRTPLARLGFVRPNWTGSSRVVRVVALGVFGGIALKLVVKALIMPALGLDAINHAYSYVTGNRSALWRMLLFVIVGGGIGEETIWRGFLFDRIKTLRSGRVGQLPIVIGTSLAFAAAHYADQGAPGAVQAIVTGLTLGGIYALSGTIWTPMLVHAAYDVTALLIIYWNLESGLAGALFR